MEVMASKTDDSLWQLFDHMLACTLAWVLRLGGPQMIKFKTHSIH